MIDEAGTRMNAKNQNILVLNPDLHVRNALEGNVCERVRLYFRVPVAMVVEAPPSIFTPSCSVTQKRIWRKALQPSHRTFHFSLTGN